MITLGIKNPKTRKIRIKVLSFAHPLISSALGSNCLTVEPGFSLTKESNGDFLLTRNPKRVGSGK